jgi:membrane protein implicated in regulation of membrane protease activity
MDFTDMTSAQMLSFYSSTVVILFGILMGLLSWLGTRLYNKLEEMSKSIQRIEGDLHERVTNIDKRLVAVESQCRFEHERRIDNDRRAGQ